MIADVIVIGAGPAGTAAAQRIAQAGYEVLILEKKRCCLEKNEGFGGALPKKCYSDLKLPEEIIEKECYNLVYHFPGEELHVSNSSGFVLFDRAAFDQSLVQKAKENGAKLLDSTLVSDVVRCDDGFTVSHEKLPEGKTQEDRARIVIFADGTRTLAFSKFQIGFDGRPGGTSLGAAYDIEYSKNDLRSMDFFFSDEVSPFGYGWVFPRKDTVNVGVACLLSKMKHDIRRYLDDFVASAALGSQEIIGYGSRLMPQSPAEKLQADSMLVVGDAAGTADPIDGGGIFNAIVSGRVAGKVAVEALEAGDVTAGFLARYEEAWKKTECYKLFYRSYLLQRIALQNDANIGVYLKQMGFFQRNNYNGRS